MYHAPSHPAPPLLPWSIFRHRAMWYIALAILASRLILVVSAARLDVYDGQRYLREATNMVDYGTYSGLPLHPPPPEAHDLPGYPLILAGLILVVKNLWVVSKVASALNAVAFALVAVELYGLVVLVGGTRRAAAWAMVLFALFPETLSFWLFLMPDSLFMVAFLAMLLLLVAYLKEPRPARLWLAFVFLGVSVLLRAVALYFTPVLVGTVLVVYLRRGGLRAGSWKLEARKPIRRALAVGLFGGLLLEAAVLSPWIIRNYRTFGTPAFTTVTGTNLLWYNYRFFLLDKGMPPAAVDALLTAQLQRAGQTPGADTNPMILASALQKLVMTEIAADPLAYARTVVKRYPRMYGGTGTLELMDMLAGAPHTHDSPLAPIYAQSRALKPLRMAAGVVLCLLYTLTIAGLVVLVRRRKWQPLAVAAVPILYFSLMYGPVTGPRYRSTMAPFFAVIACFAIPEKRQD